MLVVFLKHFKLIHVLTHIFFSINAYILLHNYLIFEMRKLNHRGYITGLRSYSYKNVHWTSESLISEGMFLNTGLY